MKTILVLAVALPLLSGCIGAVPVAYLAAAGGILTGVAAVTNADVNAAEAYCKFRGGCANIVPAPAVKP